MERLYHLVKPEQLTVPTIDRIVLKAKEYENSLRRGLRNGRMVLGVLNGVIICSFYCEESTRTRLSLESAGLRAGAHVIGSEDALRFSAMAPGKEESLENSIKVISGVGASHNRFADIIVIRSPEIGAAERAAAVSAVPIISGGDGSHHPFQVLKDIYTFEKIIGRLADFAIALFGDLRFSRIISDLAIVLSQYPGIKMFFGAPEGFELQEETKFVLNQRHVEFEEVNDIKEVICQSDIAYLVRVQKNRLRDLVKRGLLPEKEAEKLLEQYRKTRDNYAATKEVYELSEKRGTLFCHPMPVDKEEKEIRPEIEDLPRTKMYEEAGNGIPVGIAILTEVRETQLERETGKKS